MVADKTILNKGTEAPWEFWSKCGIKLDSKNMPDVELLGTVANTDHVIQLALQKA